MAPETIPRLAEIAGRVMQVLIAFRKDLKQAQLTEEDMEALRDIETAYAEWERQTKDEGSRDALTKAICALCLQLAIEVTDERRSWLASCDEDQLHSVLLAIGTSRQWPRS